MRCMAASAFPLRIRQPRLRELIREVAARERISQNELLEQAAEHEVIARGALITEDLAAAAGHLATLTQAAYREMVTASVATFAASEANPEPVQARQITRHPEATPAPPELVAVAAFQTAR